MITMLIIYLFISIVTFIMAMRFEKQANIKNLFLNLLFSFVPFLNMLILICLIHIIMHKKNIDELMSENKKRIDGGSSFTNFK